MSTSRSKNDSSLVWTVFTTAWGPMGAVGGPAGLVRIILPHYQAADLTDLLRWEYPKAERNDGLFEELQKLCRSYFNRQPTDFSTIACLLPSEKTFAGKVYCACREIPYGKTWGYRELALEIGQPDAARAVATALGKNSLPLVIPCHRVIYADGRPGGFSAEGGVALKQRMIAHEQNR
ncbi:MAG: methylated-DNA--[protein]-cysteine S-methyltransferase [Phycisphaerae bacterium]|nr:methylated-DNA--[protein]-cysteine S-methyltransferase [Phycisphaerae bacterium]